MLWRRAIFCLLANKNNNRISWLFRVEQRNRMSSSWQAEKGRYLGMSLQEKLADFRGEPQPTGDIPTWAAYCRSRAAALPARAQLAPEQFQPATDDSRLNKLLAGKVALFKGDIVSLEVDAIVNAANKSLLGGGGVDGAIHRAAGPLLKQECATLGGCETGDAKITGGYKLLAKYVIHTVGPVGEKPGLLRNCYKNCLGLVKQHGLRTVAFPCVSTGIYGYPLEPAAHIACGEVRKFLEANHEAVERIVFCVFADQDEATYQRTMQAYFPLD